MVGTARSPVHPLDEPLRSWIGSEFYDKSGESWRNRVIERPCRRHQCIERIQKRLPALVRNGPHPLAAIRTSRGGLVIHAQATRRERRFGSPGQTHDPSQLVGQWVLLRQGRSSVYGVLVHACTNDGEPREWAVRTPSGLRSGAGCLAAEPLSSEHHTQVRRARWELSALLAEYTEARDPGAMKVRDDLDLLEIQTALRP